MIDDKYLDPETNPFILKPEPEAEPSDHADLLEGRSPLGRYDLDPSAVEAGINRTWPSGNVIETAVGQLVRMSDNSWQLDGKPLHDLSGEALAALADLIKE